MPGSTRIYSQALAAFDRADWGEALRLATLLLAQSPNDGEMQFVAGVAALQLQELPLARACLQHATQLRPDRANYAAQYARALVISELMPEAIAVADLAMKSADGDATVYDTLGVVYTKANAHGPAAKAFGHAVALAPRNANYRFNLATSLMYYGDMDGAEREYETCLAIDPSYWRGYLALSQMRRQMPERNHLALFANRLEAAAHPDARLHLHLAMAKELEDMGDFPAAFRHYTHGKSAYGALMGSSAETDAAVFNAIEGYFANPRSGPTGYDNAEPIFVIGMPRTGTTLVDRILSSHSEVQSAGELGHFASALHRVGKVRARTLTESITNLGRDFDDWRELGRSYIESTRPVTGAAPHFIDKLPHNFLYAGFIARALPNAKLICVRRNPMDTCLSNFRQLFAPESAYHRYSYDMLDTGKYFVRFDRLMQRWQQLFPERILEVSYEQLVESQESVTRQLLDFCGLKWEDACMHFQSNEGPVPTASAVQVRSALNRSSLARWKQYEPELRELREFLEESGIRIHD
jgi:tetratricopeptide (TPR) repeat protein